MMLDRLPSAPPPVPGPRWFSLMPPITAASEELAAEPGCVRRIWLALTGPRMRDDQRRIDEAA